MEHYALLPDTHLIMQCVITRVVRNTPDWLLVNTTPGPARINLCDRSLFAGLNLIGCDE